MHEYNAESPKQGWKGFNSTFPIFLYYLSVIQLVWRLFSYCKYSYICRTVKINIERMPIKKIVTYDGWPKKCKFSLLVFATAGSGSRSVSSASTKTLKTKIKRYFFKHSLDSFLNQMFKIFRVLNTFLPGSGSGYVSKLGLVRGSVTKVSDPGSGSVSSIKL